MRALFRGGFRRRLVLTFITTAGLSAGALAIGTFLLVRQDGVASFAASAAEKTRLGRVIVQREHDPADLEALVRASAQSAGFETVVVNGDRTVLTSSPALEASDIPASVRSHVAAAPDSEPEAVEIDCVRYLVFGERTRDPGNMVFFLFTQRELITEMTRLARVLAALWLIVVAAAALVGDLIARRTLLPVKEAARAARSLAEGLLATRLPVRTGDEFGAWASCFNEMADALEETIEQLRHARDVERRFTADVAHELRTPLTSMVGAVSMLEEEVERLPPEARRPAALVISGVRRLRRLVVDLLELYSLDQHSPPLAIERFRMDGSVEATIELCGWRPQLALDLHPVWVDADRRRFERIATNLIGNAIEHGEEGVQVSVFEDGDEAVLEVRDEGHGIDPEGLRHVFGRFYKADPSRRKGGPGLGLAIAAENARLLGGRLEASSVPDRGTCFVFRLARAGQAPAPPSAAER